MRTIQSNIALPIKRIGGSAVEERLSENVRNYVLPARYLRRDEDRRIVESPDEMFRRVAANVAEVEATYGGDRELWEERFYELMTSLAFMPNSPTLMNAGTDLQQLAACFVVSPRDNLHSIFSTLEQAAAIFQSGGGVGYSFSDLRPAGDRVSSTGGTASGPLSFMHVYDQMCATLKQGGRRRGAQMGILRVDHPDIGRFIMAKRREGVLANFNISVAITDAFVGAVDEDESFTLVNPRTGDPFAVTEETARFYSAKYARSSPDVVEENFWRDYAEQVEGINEFYRQTDLNVDEPMELPARFIWTMLIDAAWTNGEPGIFMIDEANRDHSFDTAGADDHTIEATNPCGEQPLENYEACVLGHLNLSVMLADDAPDWQAFAAGSGGPLEERVHSYLEAAIDWQRLERTARYATRFLDDAITQSRFPIQEIEERVSSLRNIGVGIMGFAEMLIQCNVVYGSDPSLGIASQLMRRINTVTKRESHRLAEQRGLFSGWEESKYAHPDDYPDWFFHHTGMSADDWPEGLPLRNHHTTTIAPTGTTSMIANTSGGCEPLFNVVYFRQAGKDIREGRPMVVFEDYFLRILEANDVDVEAVQEEARELMDRQRFDGPESLSIPDALARLFVTADDVSPQQHVAMQAAFQEFVDSSISKTINFPFNAGRRDVEQAYRQAIDQGCKGLTVYRVGSRQRQVLSTK